MTFQKVLIANRGEIAVRIIRACRELGIATVAVYSEPDRESLHVRLADEAYCIGPTLSKDSYLNFTNIMSVATLTECDAIHPGYGFLAENADFAEICESCNITFIGPSADAINRMGDKAVAKQTMRDAGVPVIPGSDGLVEDLNEAVMLAGISDIPSLSRLLQVAEVKEFGSPRMKNRWLNRLQTHSRKPRRPSATQASIWKNI